MNNNLSAIDSIKLKAIKKIVAPMVKDFIPQIEPAIIDFINSKELLPWETQQILYMFYQDNILYIGIGFINEHNQIVRYIDVIPFSDFINLMLTKI